ncbi:hypothetical protein RDWZM_007138 [Blomia tropicalis]|uniref:Large ribosomal subunit protein uL29m n=1 Tax=Blomia tropicalis TaxID=40697 RepID=A0A9Q0M8J7_BLOTA|nr:hypothetical protein RDWZM_007138 [Blomia tropicalis]
MYRHLLSLRVNIRNVLINRMFRTSIGCCNELPKVQQQQQQQQDEPEQIRKRLMDFFDDPENWDKKEVKSGRSWKMDELRIKSNQDLHKLWYILYKERNMLMTMLEAAEDEVLNMPSPERIEKVEDSMKNIELVVQERNRAYWDLEVGDNQYVSRRRAYRKDIVGRWRWIACSEHLIPYWMNTEWRKLNGPGFDAGIVDFKRKLREKQLKLLFKKRLSSAFYVRQLMKRFDNLDLDYVQELYPDVDVKQIKSTLDEHILQDRTQRFHSLFYKKKDSL